MGKTHERAAVTLMLRFAIAASFTFNFGLEAVHASPNGASCADRLGRKDRVKVCEIANQFRKKHGRSELVLDSKLSRVAQAHAEDMLKRDYFSHESPEGETMSDRIENAGVVWQAIGENIARGQKTEDEVMKAWIGSRGHRKNILGRGFGKIGIGRADDYWVQVFTD